MSDVSSKVQPFAWRWVFASMALFVGLELIMGEGMAQLLSGRVLSDGTGMLLRNGLQLAAFFLGGLIIGVVSPKLRLIEPAIGAVGCMVLIVVLTWMTPLRFYGFGGVKLLAACAVSFGVALSGVWVGERVMGNV
jgi:hypothetical protein